jgi:hypothetical protein
VARAEVAVEFAGVGDWDASEMGADSEADEPVVLLYTGLVAFRVFQVGVVDRTH